MRSEWQPLLLISEWNQKVLSIIYSVFPFINQLRITFRDVRRCIRAKITKNQLELSKVVDIALLLKPEAFKKGNAPAESKSNPKQAKISIATTDTVCFRCNGR